jgi:CO/xanthine dehydrogenase Mo-binding subunit
MLRSPHVHAHLRAIESRAVVETPGTLAVLTGRDFLADRLAPTPRPRTPPN